MNYKYSHVRRENSSVLHHHITQTIFAATSVNKKREKNTSKYIQITKVLKM